MVRLRQAVFPAESNARTITTLSPGRRGTSILHSVDPVATPDRPPEADQLTSDTPSASTAVPLMRAVAAEVDEIVIAGVTTRKVGAVVSEPPDRGAGSTGGTGAGVGVGIITTDCGLSCPAAELAPLE